MVKLIKILICVFAIVFSATNSFSQTFIFNSFFWGFKKIKILEIKRLNFGTIESPANNVFVKVGVNGNISGSANFVDTSNASNGLMKIFGSNQLTINLQATDLGTYPFMEYTDIRGKYPGAGTFNMLNGQGNLNPPGNGKNLKIGAKLKIQAGVPQGHYQPGFAVEVLYD